MLAWVWSRLFWPRNPPLAQAEQVQQLEAELAQVKAENQRLKQELQEARRNQMPKAQKPEKRKGWFSWFYTELPIQVRVTGRTGDCENEFLKKVSDHLSAQSIRLKREDDREDSGHFLLVFCPVASAVSSNMANALKGLGSEPKAILVVLHHKVKENTTSVDTKKQAQHPAVVHTVHARYTLEDGFYACQMNKEAVAAVAEVLRDHCKGS